MILTVLQCPVSLTVPDIQRNYIGGLDAGDSFVSCRVLLGMAAIDNLRALVFRNIPWILPQPSNSWIIRI